jgi:hypothetical protein
VQYGANWILLSETDIAHGLVEAGDRPSIHLVVRPIAAVLSHNERFIAISRRVLSRSPKCFLPVCGEPLGVVRTKPAAERVTDDLVGHYALVPSARQCEQRFAAASCVVDRCHSAKITRSRPQRNVAGGRFFGGVRTRGPINRCSHDPSPAGAQTRTGKLDSCARTERHKWRRAGKAEDHTVTAAWAPDQLERICESRELEITVRGDANARQWLPIWVVCSDDRVYVRSWYRRNTGWFGRVTKTGAARVRVPGLELDVTVADMGADDRHLRATVDAAYRAKYGMPGDPAVAGMTTDEAAATTLLLTPASADVTEA